ncbi:VOC family protein [Solicola sp. PLA-1-18]|uniref:VOC family protein n=1 Tax=Solicola sp. PLA-1-18 TaxID=3380532 RepID=UPI003B7B8D4E
MATIQLVVDCSDPARLIPCWAAALDYVPAPPPAGSPTWREFYVRGGVPETELPETGDACDRIVDPKGVGPAVWFQVVPESKVVKNRLHIDVQVGGGRGVPLDERRTRVRSRVATLTALGATVLHTHEGEFVGHYATTLADPEGNEFCVV